MHQQHLAGLLILDDEGRAGHGVAHLVVAELLVPHDFAGRAVQSDHARIERTEIHLVAVDRRSAVDDVAAGADVLGQAVLVGPQALAAARVQRHEARVRGGDVDHAVVDQRLRLLAALLLAAEGVAPRRNKACHVLGVQRLQRAVALGRQPQSIGQHVFGGLGVVCNVFPGHWLDRERGKAGGGCNRQTQRVQTQGAEGRCGHVVCSSCGCR